MKTTMALGCASGGGGGGVDAGLQTGHEFLACPCIGDQQEERGSKTCAPSRVSCCRRVRVQTAHGGRGQSRSLSIVCRSAPVVLAIVLAVMLATTSSICAAQEAAAEKEDTVEVADAGNGAQQQHHQPAAPAAAEVQEEGQQAQAAQAKPPDQDGAAQAGAGGGEEQAGGENQDQVNAKSEHARAEDKHTEEAQRQEPVAQPQEPNGHQAQNSAQPKQDKLEQDQARKQLREQHQQPQQHGEQQQPEHKEQAQQQHHQQQHEGQQAQHQQPQQHGEQQQPEHKEQVHHQQHQQQHEGQAQHQQQQNQQQQPGHEEQAHQQHRGEQQAQHHQQMQQEGQVRHAEPNPHHEAAEMQHEPKEEQRTQPPAMAEQQQDQQQKADKSQQRTQPPAEDADSKEVGTVRQPHELRQPNADQDQHKQEEEQRGAQPPQRQLTPEEEERMKRIQERREARERFEKEHAGHETMHFEMFLLLIGTLIAAQIVLNLWRRYHFHSYQAVTLVGLWVFPFYFAIRHEIFHLLITWTMFTLATGYIAFKATRPQISVRTPRLVYTYFYFVIKLTSIVAVVGYFIAILDFVIGHLLPQPANTTLMALGFSSMFYGLYYGVMSRDFADICARRMATSIGYYSATGFPRKQLTGNTCAVCGDRVKTDGSERRAELDCGHIFHEFCIRGWCIVGKKQTCPYCKEKVDLARQFPSPWSRTDVTYAQLLDILRYFVVWYPVIINVVQAEYYTLGLK